MARLIILVSFLAAGAFAKRVATKHAQLESQAVADGPGILPGSVQPSLPLRPAVMPPASLRVGMSMQEAGNLGKYPADLRPPDLMKGLDTSSDVFRMSADDDQDEATEPDAASPVELMPEEVAVTEAEQKWQQNWQELSAAVAAEKVQNFGFNVLQARDILDRDIPKIVRFNSESEGYLGTKTTMNWDIYNDDLETSFTDVNPAALGLITAVTPLTLFEGKHLHMEALQELRVFIELFCDQAVMKTTKKTVARQVIRFSWKAELTMNTLFQQQQNSSDRGDGVAPEAITIYADSWFDLDDEGKIYRHTVRKLDMRLKPEDAEVPLAAFRFALGWPA